MEQDRALITEFGEASKIHGCDTHTLSRHVGIENDFYPSVPLPGFAPSSGVWLIKVIMDTACAIVSALPTACKFQAAAAVRERARQDTWPYF